MRIFLDNSRLYSALRFLPLRDVLVNERWTAKAGVHFDLRIRVNHLEGHTLCMVFLC